ncbi:MAG: hypothetical protein V7K53_24710 [Nostoc sp.]|uniref:hypothetical protein n=1 Tax=Nostoc sp. TaxID=1180 RepID=UPI002FF6F049
MVIRYGALGAMYMTGYTYAFGGVSSANFNPQFLTISFFVVYIKKYVILAASLLPKESSLENGIQSL